MHAYSLYVPPYVLPIHHVPFKDMRRSIIFQQILPPFQAPPSPLS